MIMKIFVLGPAGTNAHQAALSAFEDAGKYIQFCATNGQVFDKVTQEGGYGILPVENTTGGIVREVVDSWIDFEDNRPIVIGEVTLPISHYLLSHPTATSNLDCNAVASHPQALAQCRERLGKWGMFKTQIPTESTAAAARDLANGGLPQTCSVLASKFAGNIYGLHIGDELQDSRKNATRFHVIAHPENVTVPSDREGKNRTALIFFVDDKVGALAKALASIDVDMSSIHSIPLRDGGYGFYVEFAAHGESSAGIKILQRLETWTTKMTVLGCYSQAEMRKRRIE